VKSGMVALLSPSLLSPSSEVGEGIVARVVLPPAGAEVIPAGEEKETEGEFEPPLVGMLPPPDPPVRVGVGTLKPSLLQAEVTSSSVPWNVVTSPRTLTVH